jgi:hypothetical protein
MQTTQPDLPLICPDNEKRLGYYIGDGDKDDGF